MNNSPYGSAANSLTLYFWVGSGSKEKLSSSRAVVHLRNKPNSVRPKDAGWTRFQLGELSLGTFTDRIARAWAGFPLENGQSAYEGIAGNRAVISRKRFKEAMSAICPKT